MEADFGELLFLIGFDVLRGWRLVGFICEILFLVLSFVSVLRR